jgi:hypothetical protein
MSIQALSSSVPSLKIDFFQTDSRSEQIGVPLEARHSRQRNATAGDSLGRHMVRRESAWMFARDQPSHARWIMELLARRRTMERLQQHL